MAMGVSLILWPPLYPLPQPGYQRSTAEERQDEQEKEAVRRWRRGSKQKSNQNSKTQKADEVKETETSINT